MPLDNLVKANDRGKVRPGWDIPLNALLVTLIYTILLSLVIIGSTVAFNILLSLVFAGVFASYIIAIGCLIHRRLFGKPLPRSRFSLGRAGLAINIIAMCFLSVSWVMLFFPAAPDPDPKSMNCEYQTLTSHFQSYSSKALPDCSVT
jgi:choline transport protein